MALIFPITYGENNSTDLISGVPLAVAGLRLINHADFVGPEKLNRPLKNLARNDFEINSHLKELTRFVEDGVFDNFGESFDLVLTSSVNNTAMTFQVREGLAKIGNQAFRIAYEPDERTDYDVNEDGETIQITIPPDVTTIEINVSSITSNSFRRDMVVLNNAGEIVVIQGSNTSFLPSDYSQLDAPQDSIALYSILFRKISGVMQTPTINAIYNPVKIDGLDLIQNFTDIFGNGIFFNKPESESDPLKKEFNPSLLGGDQYFVSAGSAIINGKLVEYGTAGNSITLTKAQFNVGFGNTPGTIQGDNSNNWERVDFTTNSQGAAGVGNGNTQYLLFDNTGNTGLIDPSSIKIFTASPVGEGGYSTERPFDLDAISPATTEEYSIDITNGLIRREKTTAPLRIYIKYNFFRNRRYLVYFNEFGTLNYLKSDDVYPALPPEFSPVPDANGLPENSIALKSILYAATDNTLQPDNFGEDFRTYMNFQLENGQVTTNSIKDLAITGGKIASGAIDRPSIISEGVIVENHLSNELLSSLSSSRVYARSSLAFKVGTSNNIWTFSDNKDAVNPFLTKSLTDVTGTALTITDGNLQQTVEMPVVFKNVFKNSVSTEVEIDPELTRGTFSVNSNNIGEVRQAGETYLLSSVAISFQDFGFSQAGNVLVIIYNASTNTALATKQVPLTDIKNFVAGKTNAFYKITFDNPVELTLGSQYQIRVAKTIPTDTLYIHTASEGAGRSTDISYRIYFKPTAGKYGVISNIVQGYRIFDDHGDITVPSTDRVSQGRPASYIPYAANITDINNFIVFTDVDSSISNYVAVDVTRGIFKFTNGFEPVSSKLTTDHNIITGLAGLSSERIHRENGLTIEHTLRVLENELGSVKANITNRLEKLYYVGQALNGTGAKFRFSSQDRQLTDLNGNPLSFEDANLSSPIHVIDRNYIVPEGRESSRDIQDFFNSNDVIEFIPRFDNVAIFSINFTEAGTDYDAIELQLHQGKFDGSSLVNPPITSVTIARSEIKADFNFFTLETPLAIGETYHVLIRVVNFFGGLAIRPKLKTDVENDMIEFQQYFLPAPGKYGEVSGFSIYDRFGNLNIGSEERGALVDASQENFLDADGWQIQTYFDDNDINPEEANTTFPVFSPSRPDRTGMVRFDIYFKTVPLPGEDGYNGVFRLMLHDSNNDPIVPSNSLTGQNYLDVRVPKSPGWLKIPFLSSLIFGNSYHMHIWSNGFDLQLYVGTHSVTDQKAFRYVAGERFIPFAVNLCDNNNFEDFEIVSRKLVAIDPRCGRIKFHPDDIDSNNRYVANFNLFTNTANLQSDTIVTPEGNTIQDKLTDFVSVKIDAEPTRLGIGLYQFNKITNKISDRLGRRLERKDGELPYPYERITIEDTNTDGTPSTLTTTLTDNQYTFFVNHFEPVKIESIVLNYNKVERDYYNTRLSVSKAGSNITEAVALIKARDLKTGFNEIILEDVSGNPLNLIVEPNIQYVFRYIADVNGPGTAPKLSRNSNNTITTTIKFVPRFKGLYGTNDGVTLEDEYGDINKFNILRDDKTGPDVVLNTGSGLLNLKVDIHDNNGILVWEENKEIKASRFNVETGEIIDIRKLRVAGASGDPATNPDVKLYDNVAVTVWEQSGAIFGRRLFVEESDPLSIDLNAFKISDDGISGVVTNPSVGCDSNRMIVAWEDQRDTISGTVSSTPNAQNIFAFSFDNITSYSQYDVSANKIGNVFRVNETDNTASVIYSNPSVSVYKNRAVFTYQSDVNNIGVSNDIFLSVYDSSVSGMIRSDIRVDKAQTTETSIQVDSIKPIVKNYRSSFVLSWLDNRNSVGVQYQPFVKVYDSNTLTFNQTDILADNNISGIVEMGMYVADKFITVGMTDNSKSYLRRFDLKSLEPHDVVSFDVNFNSSRNNFSTVHPACYGKMLNVFLADSSGNAILHAGINGITIEPVAVDLSNTDVEVRNGYVGIDVVNGIYKFSEGEEI